MNSYEEKLARRKQYYIGKSKELASASNAEYERYNKMGEAIPFGQPILIGHYSEKTDRAYRGRMVRHMEKSIELGKKSEYYMRKAEGVGKGGISSDDPDAVKKLTAKLEELKDNQTFMKEVNKAIRLKDIKKGDERLIALGIIREQIPEYRKPGVFGIAGFPRYMLSNNLANIHRIEKRIKSMERMKEQEESTDDVETDLYKFCVADNRVQFIFDGKPAQDVRDVLKAHSFRWSPLRSAWVRQNTVNGMFAAKEVMEALDSMEV